jgi:hypothetical protein
MSAWSCIISVDYSRMLVIRACQTTNCTMVSAGAQCVNSTTYGIKMLYKQYHWKEEPTMNIQLSPSNILLLQRRRLQRVPGSAGRQLAVFEQHQLQFTHASRGHAPMPDPGRLGHLERLEPMPIPGGENVRAPGQHQHPNTVPPLRHNDSPRLQAGDVRVS